MHCNPPSYALLQLALVQVGQYVMVFMPPGDRITPVLLTLCEVNT